MFGQKAFRFAVMICVELSLAELDCHKQKRPYQWRRELHTAMHVICITTQWIYSKTHYPKCKEACVTLAILYANAWKRFDCWFISGYYVSRTSNSYVQYSVTAVALAIPEGDEGYGNTETDLAMTINSKSQLKFNLHKKDHICSKVFKNTE